MTDHVFELVKAQIARRLGREPQKGEMAEALALCDPELVSALATRLEIKKALAHPLIDFTSFGGNRAGAATAVPADGSGSEDGLEKAGAALDAASRHLIELGRASIAAARGDDDFRRGRGGRGGTFAKRRGVPMEDIGGELAEIERLLKQAGLE